MRRETELIKNAGVLAIGQFLPKMISIVTIPILTAQLTKSQYGIYDFISTLVLLLLPVATLQIQSGAFRFLIDCRENQEEIERIVSSIMIVVLSSGVIVTAILSIFLGQFDFLTKVAISGYFLFDIINQTIGQIVRGLGKNKCFAISSIYLSIVEGSGIIVGVQIAKMGLTGVFMSLCMANIFSVVYQMHAVDIKRYIKINAISMIHIKKMIHYSWPIIPNNFSNWVLKLSDRVIITAVLGVEANAIYAVANKIPSFLFIAQSVLIMAWQENASIAVKDKVNEEYFEKVLDNIFCLMIGGTALLIGFLPLIFRLLIRGNYDAAYGQIPVLFLGVFFGAMSSFWGGLYIAYKKTVSLGITTIGAAVLNVIIDILFVNSIGISAGSLSTLVSYFFLYIYRMIDIQKIQKIRVKFLKQAILLFFIIVMIVICVQNSLQLNVMNALIGIIFSISINLKSIKMVVVKLLIKTGKQKNGE